MEKEEQKRLVKYITEMKFIPGGRYLWYAGRKLHFYNNCGVGETRLLTRDGYRKFADIADGEAIQVASPVSGFFEDAIFKHHGTQPVFKINLKNHRGSSSYTRSVKFTAGHRWMTERGILTTEELLTGDIIPANTHKFGEHHSLGFIHGLIFADGNVHVKKRGFGHQLRLCGRKRLEVDRFEGYTITYPTFANGDPVVYIKSDYNMKELPVDKSVGYIQSFIRGWLLFDGYMNTDTGCGIVHSIDQDAINWLSDNMAMAGFVQTGDIRVNTKPSNFGERRPLYSMSFQHGSQFNGFKVDSIEYAGEERVYCPYEPKYERIVVDHGIDTFNCFVFIGEEDTREEWARLSHDATSALMSGGGIGIDYSVFRPAGRILSRTGGISSGPVPLMKLVNEIGRNVMQGGSRRSAIYASLNWQHDDIEDFTKIKDWSPEIRALKELDFNFPAPLDMTNISVNWGTEFIEGVKKDSVPDLWYNVCKSMCRTGEPGHSFNFYENEKETGRNAYISVCAILL